MHALLAGMHVGGDVHARQAPVRQRRGVHERDDDADDLAVRFERPIGHRAHQAGLAPAEDQLESAPGQHTPGSTRGLQIVRRDAVSRAAKNTDGFHAAPPSHPLFIWP
jgi:hypothetical protein